MDISTKLKPLNRATEDIISHINHYQKSILSVMDLGKILSNMQDKFILSNSIYRKKFIDFLIEKEIVKEVKISLPKKTMTKYLFGSVSKYELALSINPKSYLSHYTALFLHDLIENVPKLIYTNMEQFKKSIKTNTLDLQQQNIDKAFSRPMRKTNNIAKLEDFNVVLLNGKNLDRLEVVDIDVQGKKLPVTSIERTLIDIVTRPEYAGGVSEILRAYECAKGLFFTSRLIATLNKMDYAYPYHQAIGFYLERAGYEEKVLRRFDKLNKNVDFYLTYQMKDKLYSKRWQLYYPSYLG